MISPTTFAACGNPCMLCGSGIVAPDLLYSGVAFLGINLNQMADSEVASAVTPTGSALTVSFSNPGGSALRVQLGGPNGATSALERWCYTLTGASGTVTIPYSSFNTTCWDGLGAAYNREPLMNIQLLVPGNDVSSVSFNVCLTGLSDGGVQ
jgi:hypothetical protein